MENPNFGPCSNPFCDWYGHRCTFNMCGICCRLKHPILCREKHPGHPERNGYRNLTKIKRVTNSTPTEPEKPIVPVLGELTEIKDDLHGE